MRRWLAGGCFVMAYVVVPVYVEWLRHRPHRLTVGTQHIVLAGLVVQVVFVILAALIWRLA